MTQKLTKSKPWNRETWLIQIRVLHSFYKLNLKLNNKSKQANRWHIVLLELTHIQPICWRTAQHLLKDAHIFCRQTLFHNVSPMLFPSGAGRLSLACLGRCTRVKFFVRRQLFIQKKFKVSQGLRLRNLVPSNTAQWEQWENCNNLNGSGSTQNTHSGTPSGGRTTDKMLSMSLYFSILSFTVVDVRDGDAFTSTSQGFRLLSIMISYP